MTYTLEQFTTLDYIYDDSDCPKLPMIIDDFHHIIHNGKNINFARVTFLKDDPSENDVDYTLSVNTIDYDETVGNWDETLITPINKCFSTPAECLDFINNKMV